MSRDVQLDASTVTYLRDMGSSFLLNMPDDVQDLDQDLDHAQVNDLDCNDRDPGHRVKIELPLGCTSLHVDAIVSYLRRCITTPELLLGDCTETIAFMGLEHLFNEDEEGNLVPSMDRFEIQMMLASQAIWLQHRRDRHLRSGYWKNTYCAVQAQSNRMTRETLAMWPDVNYQVQAARNCSILRPAPDAPEIKWADFRRRVQQLPRGLPWSSAGTPGVVIAGGAVESWLLGKTPNDIDIFLIWPGHVQNQEDRDQGNYSMHAIVHKTIEAIAAHHGGQIYIVNRASIIDIVAHHGNIKYQIIMLVYSSVAQLTSGFDIDSCRIALTQDGLFGHETAMRAWKHGWNLFDAGTLSTTALHRYSKKFVLGFGILVIGMSQERLDAKWAKAQLFAESFERGMESLPRRMSINIESLLLHIAIGPTIMQRIMNLTSDYDYCGSSFKYFRVARSTCCLDGAQRLDFKDGFYSHGILVHTSQQSRCIHLEFRFNVNTDAKGNFTGAFNPMSADIYSPFIK